MICCRCGTTFRVYPDKPYPKFADCVYHWGKAWKKRSMEIDVELNIICKPMIL